MANDKQFEATHARLARAKREGDVPRSQDLTALGSLGGAACALLAALGGLRAAAGQAVADAARGGSITGAPYAALAASAGGVICAALAGALGANYLQTGTLTLKFPAPKFDTLNPVAGLKRMLSRDGAMRAAKALCVGACVCATLVPIVRDAFYAGAMAAKPSGPAALAALASNACEKALFSAVAVGLVFAAADVLLERAKWKRRLRMDYNELKGDHKASEGDPLLRGRRRQSHRALVRGSIGRVKDAAFVVTNPTHIALAFEYRPPDVAVPRVIVRAIDAGARAVKERARELRVPIVEDVALARALLATTDVGDYIPPDAYAAMAAIVAGLLRENLLVA